MCDRFYGKHSWKMQTLNRKYPFSPYVLWAAAVAGVQIYLKSYRFISYHIFIDRWMDGISTIRYNVNFFFVGGKNCAHFFSSHSDCRSKFTRIYGNPNQSIYFQSIDLIAAVFEAGEHIHAYTLLHRFIHRWWCSQMDDVIQYPPVLFAFYRALSLSLVLTIHSKFGNVIFFGINSAS